MSRFRFYIKPFDDAGEYQADFVEVTNDVDSNQMGQIKRKTDNDEFDVGVFKFSAMQLVLDNSQGKYAEAGYPDSIFKFNRNDSIVRITWDLNDHDQACGIAVCGESELSEEREIFRGLLSDKSFSTDIQTQKANFSLLGFESLFERVEFPFSEVTPGMTAKQLLVLALDQVMITDLMTVLDANINPDLNIVPDDTSSFENQMVKNVVNRLLQLTGSVLFIEDQVVYVQGRSQSGSVVKQFYGQASPSGPENVIDIDGITSGINRTFNFWTWRETSLFARDTTSVDTFSTLSKEIDDDMVTDSGKRQTILDALRTEWAFPKREMDLKCFLDYENLSLGMFDKVTIDYPPIYYQFEEEPLAIYDQAIYDDAVYPLTQWALVLDDTYEFKIVGFEINLKDQNMVLNIREV